MPKLRDTETSSAWGNQASNTTWINNRPTQPWSQIAGINRPMSLQRMPQKYAKIATGLRDRSFRKGPFGPCFQRSEEFCSNHYWFSDSVAEVGGFIRNNQTLRIEGEGWEGDWEGATWPQTLRCQRGCLVGQRFWNLAAQLSSSHTQLVEFLPFQRAQSVSGRKVGKSAVLCCFRRCPAAASRQVQPRSWALPWCCADAKKSHHMTHLETDQKLAATHLKLHGLKQIFIDSKCFPNSSSFGATKSWTFQWRPWGGERCWGRLQVHRAGGGRKLFLQHVEHCWTSCWNIMKYHTKWYQVYIFQGDYRLLLLISIELFITW